MVIDKKSLFRRSAHIEGGGSEEKALPELRAGSVPQALRYYNERRAESGEVLIRENDPANHFYILVEGEVLVTRRDAGEVDRPVATLSAGNYFEEVGLLEARPRTATVRVISPGGARLLVAEKAGVERLIADSGGPRGDLARALSRQVASYGNPRMN